MPAPGPHVSRSTPPRKEAGLRAVSLSADLWRSLSADQDWPDQLDITSYGRAHAASYDELYPEDEHRQERAELFRSLAGYGTILELGVGTGRLALPLKQAGFRVTGVDCSPEMLAVLQAKDPESGIELVLGDITNLPAALPDRRFDIVYASMSVLYSLPSHKKQLACLQGARNLLDAHGYVIVEAWVPQFDWGSNGRLMLRDAGPSRAIVGSFEHSSAAQVIRHTMHVIRPKGHIETLNRKDCYVTVPQCDYLAWRAGLRLVRRWSGDCQSPFASSSNVHISAYRLRSSANS